MSRNSPPEGAAEESRPEDTTQTERVVQVHRLSKVGAPPKYRPEMCETAAQMASQGATDFEIAQALDVHAATLYRWQHEHPEFREALKLGKEAADDRVERTLYHRAIGYSHQAVKVMQDKGYPVVVEYVEHVAPDVGAMTLWLTNRRKDDWRSRQSHELTGPNGGPITTRSADDLTDEQLAAIAAEGATASDCGPSGSAPPEPEDGTA